MFKILHFICTVRQVSNTGMTRFNAIRVLTYLTEKASRHVHTTKPHNAAALEIDAIHFESSSLQPGIFADVFSGIPVIKDQLKG